MKVVILCGGLGTRLREETEFRPKPMVPVGERPILWHIMKYYSQFGHDDFILCLGYKGEVIKDFFRNYHWNTSDVTLELGSNPKIKYHSSHLEEKWKVTLVDTGANSMTGGRLKRVLPYIEDDNFLLTYGDGLTNSDINKSIEQHLSTKPVMTLTAVQPMGRFGELSLDGNLITSFQEKPDQETRYINGGFFVVNKTIDNYLKGDDTILEKDPMRSLAESQQLHAYYHRGFWQCMDTYREQQYLSQLWTNGEAPWKIW